MTQEILSMALAWGILLLALCSSALLTSSGQPCIAQMICAIAAEQPFISLLDGDPDPLNKTTHDADCEVVLEANSGKIYPTCSEGFVIFVYHWLHEAKDEKQDEPERALFVCRYKQNKAAVKSDAVYMLKAIRSQIKAAEIKVYGKEGPQARQAWHDEGSIYLRVVRLQDNSSNVLSSVLAREISPVSTDDLVRTTDKAAIAESQNNPYHGFHTAWREGGQVLKEDSEKIRKPLVICKPFRGLSDIENISNLVVNASGNASAVPPPVAAPLNGSASAPVVAQVASPLTASANAPVVAPKASPLTASANAPVVAPVASPLTASANAPVVAPVAAPGNASVLAPAPAPAAIILTPPPPPPPMKSPPPTPAPPSKTSPPPPPPPSLFFFPPAPPPPNSPPVAYLNIPPGQENLIPPTINAPDNYKIANVSVYITGVAIPFINITPSSVILQEVAALQKRSDNVAELPGLVAGQNPRSVRRLFQAAPTPLGSRGISITASTTWVPKNRGVSTQLRIFLQVEAGSLVILLPGYLLQNTLHQPTMTGEWTATMNSSDPSVWVPGAGIQFLGTVSEVNAALSTLMFGLGVGTGKGKLVNLLVLASHTFNNLSSIANSQAEKVVTLNVAGAGAWFTIFTYTKTFYQSSVGVLTFCAIVLILLCCILGCCVCHDAKMEKIFQQNKTVLKAQNAVFNETRVFNPVWIPSAPVLPGRDKFVVIHNPKFLQQRLAEHLSRLHRTVIDKVISVLDLRRGKGEESLGLRDDENGSDQGSATPTGREDSSRNDSASSQSTHYSIMDNRKFGFPLLGMPISPGSDSTHYDIGSPDSASGSDETESANG